MLAHAVKMRRGDGPASEGNDGRGSADANADAAEERQRLTAITEHLMNNLDFARGFVDDVSVKYVRGVFLDTFPRNVGTAVFGDNRIVLHVASAYALHYCTPASWVGSA